MLHAAMTVALSRVCVCVCVCVDSCFFPGGAGIAVMHHRYAAPPAPESYQSDSGPGEAVDQLSTHTHTHTHSLHMHSTVMNKHLVGKWSTK